MLTGKVKLIHKIVFSYSIMQFFLTSDISIFSLGIVTPLMCYLLSRFVTFILKNVVTILSLLKTFRAHFIKRKKKLS